VGIGHDYSRKEKDEMKIRAGFVSNSSSTAFILDLRAEGVKEMVEQSSAPRAHGLGRGTAMAVGKAAVFYAEDWIEDTADWYEEGEGLGPWIMKWANELGHDNVVFIRESDEGMGGYINFPVHKLAVAEMEYH